MRLFHTVGADKWKLCGPKCKVHKWRVCQNNVAIVCWQSSTNSNRM